MNRKEILLFLLLLTCFTFFVQWSGAEQRSFFSLILALHNDHSLIIDRYAEMTPDKAQFNGHYYSDKAPGLSFLGLPVYAAINTMQHLDRPGLFLPYSIYMVSAFVVSLPSALLAILVLRFLLRIGITEPRAFATTAVMALGTLALPFSTLFFSHQTAAFLVFAGFYLLFMVKPTGGLPATRLFLAGLILGVAVLVEYPMVVMAVILLLYALTFVQPRRVVVSYLLGGLPPALALMAYNSAAFQHPLHFSYFYEANTWAQIHQQGFLGLGLPRLSTLATVLAGSRGLLTLSPVLILVFYGLWVMMRNDRWRAEGMLFLTSFSIYLLMTSGYKVPPTDIWVPGPRFLVPVLPFLAAPLAFSLPRLRWLFAPLAMVSVAIMFLVTASNPQVPPEISNPLFEWWLPGLLNRSQIVHSLPELRFGISRGLSLLLLAGEVGLAALSAVLACLLASKPHAQSAVLSTLAVLMLLAYLVIGFPIDLLRPFDVPASLLEPTAALPAGPAAPLPGVQT